MNFPGKGYPWKKFLLDLKNEYQRDKVGDAAGALTYFGVLALFPFLLFLVSLASLVIDPAQANALINQLGQVAPKDVTNILSNQIQMLGQSQNVGLLTIGVLGALWSASSGIGAVMRALNTAYDVEESRPFWKTRGIALLFTLFGGALGVIAALVMVALPGVANSVGGVLGTWIVWLRIPVAGVIVMFAWAVAYWALPDVEQRFKFITPGSVVGVIIWVLASLGFSFYVSNFGKYNATYGALGAVIVMLLWLWISAQVLIVGAEVNALIEHASAEGKDVGEKTLQGAEVRSGGAVSSRYGKGKPAAAKQRAAAREREEARSAQERQAQAFGERRPEPGLPARSSAEARPAEARRPEPSATAAYPARARLPSPTQARPPSPQQARFRSSAQPQPPSSAQPGRPEHKAGRRLALAVWGALVGAVLIEGRRRRLA